MAKKQRFPLIMDEGVEVSTLEELRENFSVEKVLEYMENISFVRICSAITLWQSFGFMIFYWLKY
jgi:hypothetical protein